MLNRSLDDTSRPLTGIAPFVGRDAELRVMRAALEKALDGQGQVVLLAGEAGIGKTRTSEELAHIAREQGALVLWGRCREWEGAPPYWPWVQVARSCLRGHDPAELLPEAEVSTAIIAQIVPELRARGTNRSQLPEQAETARFLLFDTFTRWLNAVAEQQPLVLVLDDLHRADTPSLLLLQFVSAGLVDARVLIVGTWRDDEVGRDHPLSAALAEITRVHSAQRVGLRGWPLAEAERFMRITAGQDLPTRVVAAIHSETEGNPFFVTEIIRMLAESGSDGALASGDLEIQRLPESVRDVILQRVDRLSAECVEALSAAAIVGRDFTRSALQRVLDWPPPDLLDAIDEAQRARIVEGTETIGGFRFTHVLIRDTLVQALPSLERARLHQQAGQMIEQLFAADLAPHSADLAHHFAQALPIGDAAKAVSYARMAGEWAMGRVAWEDAVAHCLRALELLEQQRPDDAAGRCDLLLALGEARWNGGSPDEARSLYRVAADLARDLESPEHFARAALGVAGSDVVGTVIADRLSVALLEEALSSSSTIDDQRRVRLLCQLAFALFEGDDTVERQLALTSEALGIARRLADPDVLAQALDTRWYALLGPDGLHERLAIAAEQLQVAQSSGNRHDLMMAHGSVAADALESGDLIAYRRQVTAYATLADQLRMPAHVLGSAFMAIFPILAEGKLGEVDRRIAAIPSSHRGVLPDDAEERMVNQAILALHRERSLLGDALDIATRMIDTARLGDNYYWQAEFAVLLHEHGHVHVSQRLFASLAADDFAGIPRDGCWLNTLTRLSEAAVLLGDTVRSGILYDLLRPYPERNACRALSWWCHGSVSHYLGLLATTLSRWDDAEHHFADALAMHERMGALLFATWTRAAWAEMLALRPDTATSQRPSDLANRALTDAVAIGSLRIETRMCALLGSAPTRVRSATPYALSPREMDVLRLIVDGKTDREIAEELFISHRTVMRHVTGILNKLGVNSRTAAATLAVRNRIL